MERKVEGVTPEYSLVSQSLKGTTQGDEFFVLRVIIVVLSPWCMSIM